MAQKDELSNVIDTCMRHGLNWAECPAYRRILGSDIERSRLVRVPGFRAEMAEAIKQWVNEWSVRETGREMFPEPGTVTLSEGQLRKVISESIRKALSEEGIHIKEKNRGKFNATKERTGKSTEELAHSKNPLTRKRAVFAQNAKKWNKKK